MAKVIPVSYEGKPCYKIVLEQDYSKLLEYVKELGYQAERKICIVTDTNLKMYHLDTLEAIFKENFHTVISFVFPAGEESKNLDTVQELYKTLIENRFDRKDILIAFGGGVVGDLTGFTAATYLRGIDFIQVPTSLLSQVDSSIGGKTGVDFSQYKNMVGAFYQPKLVYMNLDVLHTLPKEQFISGMGEILKHGLIKSKDYFTWMEEQYEKIMALDADAVEEMVYQSCLIKRDVVENDPKEKGERALLNFGHTLGHAIEKLSDFSLFHGQCVGIGMAAACYISMECGHITKEEYAQILETFKHFGLPITVSGLTVEEIIEISKSDKKMEAGKIKFILLEAIGKAYINPDLTYEQITAGAISVLEK